MKSAYRIGTLSRIGIYMHWSFPFLLAGLFAYYIYRGASVTAALAGLALVMTVFGCVLLHEMGHALMARRFGIKTLDITMYPIGGIARLQQIPSKPMEELWIAVAGPTVNLVIAAGLYVINLSQSMPVTVHEVLADTDNVLGMLMYLNLAMAAFNMLPAFPMDGGRVLRAGLATQIPYRRATLIAVFIGQVMAFGFGVAGLFMFNPVLIFIALFVFSAAAQEGKMAQQM